LKFRDSYENAFMNIGIGLGVFVVIATIIGILHIPLDYKIFFFLALIAPILELIHIIKNKLKIQKPKGNYYAMGALIISIISLIILTMGAFGYQWPEDDDPAVMAAGAKYIAETGSAFEPEGLNYQYLDPYPPAYGILMAMLHQQNDSIINTLKFFNVLLISLAIMFFYFFAERFTGSQPRALAATFVLACLPCFMSHFIWAQTLAVTLMFPAFYCVLRAKEYKWAAVGSILIAAIFISQPSTAAIFLLMFCLFWIGSVITTGFKDNMIQIYMLVAGGAISGIYWGSMFFRYSIMGTLSLIGFSVAKFSDATMDTSGGAYYTIQDYLIAPMASKFDQPTGIGIVAFLVLILSISLIILGLIGNKELRKNRYIIVTMIWFVFTLLAVEANALPIKLFPHRCWVFLSLPVALLIAECLISLHITLKKSYLGFMIIGLVCAGIIGTSALQRISVQTSQWAPGVHWTGAEELQGFIWLKELPPDTKVFHYTMENKGYVIGFDKNDCMWCDADREFRADIFNKNAAELYDFLKTNKYEYLIISGMSYRPFVMEYGENKTMEHMDSLFRDIQTTPNYQLAHQTNGAIILKVI
ncbi:MAG TPA: hypothetical protein VMV86_00500, partial [Methanosarcinales archaeon]|nr:hypothetical protein [Methanosarcinales archaeon]